MRRILYLLLSLTLLTGTLQAYILPNEFKVYERWFSWTSTFDIEVDGVDIAKLRRRFFSWTTQYDLTDTSDELLATARMRFFTFGAIFDISDASDNALGTVEEKVFTFFPTFRIFSPRGDLLINAKRNFWGTKYTLTAPLDDHVVATITRPFFRLRDVWTTTILDHEYFYSNDIDPLLIITIAAFQTDLDKWKKQVSAMHAATTAVEDQSTRGLDKVKKDAVQDYKAYLNKLAKALEALQDKVDLYEPSENDLQRAAEMVDDYLSGSETNGDLTKLQSFFEDEATDISLKNAFYHLLYDKVQEETTIMQGD